LGIGAMCTGVVPARIKIPLYGGKKMNSDIRVLVSFKGQRKRKRLEMILGPGATGHLIDLWLTAAIDRPDGILSGYDETDIKIAAGWEDDPKKLVKALIDTKWLDKEKDGTFVLHGWQEHQGWCVGANDRSNKARINALIGHHGREKGLKIAAKQYGINPIDHGYQSATSTLPETEQHAKRNAPSPSPSPSPTRKEAYKQKKSLGLYGTGDSEEADEIDDWPGPNIPDKCLCCDACNSNDGTCEQSFLFLGKDRKSASCIEASKACPLPKTKIGNSSQGT